MKASIERKITIWFLLVSVIGTYFTYQTFKSRIDYFERGKWVKHSYHIQSEIQTINTCMQQMEIQSHHYLLTGRNECLKSYDLALDSLNKSVAHFAQLINDNPRQHELLRIFNRLRIRINERNQASFRSREMLGGLKAITMVAEGYNQNLIDSLRIVIDHMDYEEDMRLDEKVQSQQNASHMAVTSLIIMVSLFLIVIGVFYWLILHDIRKRRIAEMQLKKNEAFLFMIFNESKDALFIINPKTNMIESCNKAAVEMFEVQDKLELLNQFGAHYRKSPIGENELKRLDAVLDAEGDWAGEVEYISKAGRTFWGAVSLNAFEFNSEMHRLYRVTDITQSKKSGQILKNYAEALEESKSRLYSLTSELLLKNNELKKSEAALRDLNANKDKFFSILAHDMRSPFSGLLGMSQYLADYQDLIPQGEIKDIADSIYASARKIYGLLNNLLEWSRLQMGKIEFLPSAVNLLEIADEIVELLLPNAECKSIFIKNKIGNDIHIYADQNMISTIFRNLISNAIKFTGVGGEVTISAKATDQFAEICVADTGIGMDDEVKNKIFRIDSKYSTKGTLGEEGTGLGLVLCRELVEKNHGNIYVESQPGQGTKFTFTLPLLQEEIMETQ
ncbi:MAG: ATP-binding protein [Acidobacteriota bacterium]